MTQRPIFYYDIASAYAYLASGRIGELLPEAEWQPVLNAGLLKASGRTSWAFGPELADGIAEVERRAAEYGLPPVRWPTETALQLATQRAAVVAKRAGREVEFSLAAFHAMWVDGRDLRDRAVLVELASASGLDGGELTEAIEHQDVKDELRAATDAAFERGVVGVPSVAIDGEVFWGDDRLDEAVAAAR